MKKVEIVKDNCIACGLCYSTVDSIFAADDDGTSRVIKEILTEEEADEANVCPVGAIIFTDVKTN